VADSNQEKAKQGCIGCLVVALGLLAVFTGCTALLRGPEKLTEKCEKDLQSRYQLTGYNLLSKTGFVTISAGKDIETVAFQFFYDGEKGSSIAAQEQRAPIFKGRANCRIDKNTKEVRTTFERIYWFAGE
jgi:hypothetical protein